MPCTAYATGLSIAPHSASKPKSTSTPKRKYATKIPAT